MQSITEDRKNPRYRFLEGSIGYASISILIFVFVITIINPSATSVLLIICSLLWLLKYTLNVMYTIYSYQRLRRWEKLDWVEFINDVQHQPKKAFQTLDKFQHQHKSKLNWVSEIEGYKQGLIEAQDTKYSKPLDIYQFATFSIYNEPPEVLAKSLEYIFNSGYPLDKICVFVSQEQRAGEVINNTTKDYVEKLDWTTTHDFLEEDLEIVYAKHKSLQYSNSEAKKTKLSKTKLNIFFTQHPDGLVGEIKGKASNEDWGTRQASLWSKARDIDPEMTMATSLDADSHIGKYFFHNLVFRYITTKDKLRSGYQPVHVYSNNFFQVHVIPRLIATQTGISNLTNLTLEGENPFFAIYALPLTTLQEVDFWIRDVIAEDAMLFNKCLIHFDANFTVYSFYGIFEGDALEGETFIQSLVGQYKQLQRWAWGGVEDFPYIYKNFFWTERGQKIDLRKRLRWVYLKFSNHLFWSSAPLLFSVGMILPSLLGGRAFRQNPASQNLSLFSTYFSWASFIFIFTFAYITLFYFARKATKGKRLTFWQSLAAISQFLISPIIFGLIGIPALDAQIKGIRSKYLGYWVTPKK